MIGANLVPRLVTDGFHVGVLTRAAAPAPGLAGVANRIQYLMADLLDREAVRRAVEEFDPEGVVHLASTVFNPPPTNDAHMHVNVVGLTNLLDALSSRNGLRIVHAGSAAQYGSGNGLRETAPERPATWLGFSKSCASFVLHGVGRMHGFETVELRLFTPFGPWEAPRRLIPHTVLSVLRGETVKLSDGRPERDFVYIDDVVEAFISALTRPLPPGTVLNIASGVGRSVASVAHRILELMSGDVQVQFGTQTVRPDEIWKMTADISRAADVLNWQPKVEFDDGLGRTINWFRSAGSSAQGPL